MERVGDDGDCSRRVRPARPRSFAAGLRRRYHPRPAHATIAATGRLNLESRAVTADARFVGNAAVVERWLASSDDDWPTEDDLAALLDPDVRLVGAPSLVNPSGDLPAMVAGPTATVACWRGSSYGTRDHVAVGCTVVTRLRWTRQIAIAAGPWPVGTPPRPPASPGTGCAERRRGSRGSSGTTATSRW